MERCRIPERLFAYLAPGAFAALLTVGEDRYAHVAYVWAVAPGRATLRFCADHGSSTLANLERDGRAALQIIGPGDLVFVIKGPARKLAERLAAAPMPAALWELAVASCKDQSWPGVSLTPVGLVWPEARRESMGAMERALYAEMRSGAG